MPVDADGFGLSSACNMRARRMHACQTLIMHAWYATQHPLLLVVALFWVDRCFGSWVLLGLL